MKRKTRLTEGQRKWAARILHSVDIRHPDAVQRELARHLVFLQGALRTAESDSQATREHRSLIAAWGKTLDRIKATRERR